MRVRNIITVQITKIFCNQNDITSIYYGFSYRYILLFSPNMWRNKLRDIYKSESNINLATLCYHIAVDENVLYYDGTSS